MDGKNWDKYLNKVNALIAQLAIQNFYIDEKVKKSMLIRSLPEYLPILCTVASAQPAKTVETLYALIRAELHQKKNPNNLQGLNRNSSITPKASQAKKRHRNGQRFNRNSNKVSKER